MSKKLFHQSSITRVDNWIFESPDRLYKHVKTLSLFPLRLVIVITGNTNIPYLPTAVPVKEVFKETATALLQIPLDTVAYSVLCIKAFFICVYGLLKGMFDAVTSPRFSSGR